ncbi:DUF7663 domain-containing protein [Ancylomarina sp. YFZ004]
MSIQLLEDLNGNNNGKLKQLINQLKNEPEPRLCWYPSGERDFRPLMYLHPLLRPLENVDGRRPAPPDIYIYTGYFPNQSSGFLDTAKLYDDGRTVITVESIEELPKLDIALHPEISEDSIHSPATNRVFFMTIKIKCNRLGEITYPLIYAFANNIAFCAERLIPNNALISHIIHIKHNDCFRGGGKATGRWILNVLKILKCECFISFNKYQEGIEDEIVNRHYPILANDTDLAQLEPITPSAKAGWGSLGIVSWYLVL